jgi:CRP-like cAMP-binding protein
MTLACSIGVLDQHEGALDLLTRSSLCRGLSVAVVRTLTEHASLLERARGDTLYTEGEPAKALLLVSRGVIKLVRALESGRDVIIEIVGPGEIIGEAALTDGAVHDARAVCVHPSTLMAIPREDVLAFIGANPAAVRNVIALLHASLLGAHRRVEDMAVFGVRQRIARLFLRMADWTGRPVDDRIVVPVALSRQELAALVGTTTETTIRVMHALREEGLVEPARRGVVLLDRAALELVASSPSARSSRPAGP